MSSLSRASVNGWQPGARIAFLAALADKLERLAIEGQRPEGIHFSPEAGLQVLRDVRRLRDLAVALQSQEAGE